MCILSALLLFTLIDIIFVSNYIKLAWFTGACVIAQTFRFFIIHININVCFAIFYPNNSFVSIFVPQGEWKYMFRRMFLHEGFISILEILYLSICNQLN